jgi:3-oxoacyl-[acyl-carrier protein] reductase
VSGDADFSLEGRVALVTGATRGIGAAITRRFVASGARVAITHRGTERNERLSAALLEELGEDRFLPIVADAADSDQMAAAVRAADSAFAPGVDTVIANAAATDKLPWNEISVEQWDEIMAVNLRGAFVAALHAAEGMRQRGYGKIITVGSVMANIGDPRALHYVTSKGGLVAFARSLARAEGANGIRVNCVVPGAIVVEREAEEGGDPAATLAWMQQVQSLPWRGVADDIAATCQFLASHASDFITGQVLTVDGGWSNY